MEVKINKQDNNTTVVRLEGRLDTPTAQEVNQRLLPVQEDASGTIILDCEELTYISSSGLRAVMLAVKTMAGRGSMRIVNVGKYVYEVLETTGFVGVCDVEPKA